MSPRFADDRKIEPRIKSYLTVLRNVFNRGERVGSAGGVGVECRSNYSDPVLDPVPASFLGVLAPDPAYTRSMMMAGAIPPPVHIVISAVFRSRRSSSSSAVPIRIDPVAPIG